MALIDDVKATLNIDFTDETLLNGLDLKIKSVQGYMKNAGVSDAVMLTDSAVMCISVGVQDLMGTESGALKFSAIFEDLLAQLR